MGFHRTRDHRFIHITARHVLPRFLDASLDLLGCSHTFEDVAEAISGWDAQVLEERLGARRVPASVARSAGEWRSHPQGRILSATKVVEVDQIGPSASEPFKDGARPLSGVRVLDLSHVICGPMIARTLAAAGAEVLRVNNPYEHEEEAILIDTGWGKRSAYCDLASADDVEALADLVRAADVVVQSWRPGALARRGFGATEVARLRPGIVYVSVSCFGASGPWSGRGGYDPTAMAASGIAVDEGLEGVPTMPVTGTLNDYLAAYLGAAGVVAALAHRAEGGGSHHVGVALARSSMWLQDMGMCRSARRSEWIEPVRPELVSLDGPYGRVETLGLPIAFGETPTFWDRPPEPPGASPLAWLEQ